MKTETSAPNLAISSREINNRQNELASRLNFAMSPPFVDARSYFKITIIVN